MMRDVIELRSPGGVARATVLPQYGGRLHQLWVERGGRWEPLLWAPDDSAAYGERPTRGGCFPMAPWPNRIAHGRFSWEGQRYTVPTESRTHAIHGRVLQHEWRIVEANSVSCLLACDLDGGWPWRGTVMQRLRLDDRELSAALWIETGERFPHGLGWHPWFRRDVAGANEVRLVVPAAERYVLEENIPTGEVVPVAGEFDLREGPPLGDRRLDDCYRGMKGPIRMDWGRLQLDLSMDGGAADLAPHVQVYTPPQAFCVEPQTCAPDAFNLAANGFEGAGVLVTAPGRRTEFGMTWVWSRVAEG